MKRLDLSALDVFREVARQRSFSRAAAVLEVTPTALSKTMRRFETQLGVRLLNRTSRAVQLTAEGARLLEVAGPALTEIEQAVEALSDEQGAVHGTLKVTLPTVAYALLLEPHLGGFWKRYPSLRMDLSIDDGLRDIVVEGFDAGIRLGERLALDMVATRLGGVEPMVLVAAPSYLESAPPILAPQDLATHDCIRFKLRSTGSIYPWRLQLGAETHVISVGGRLVLDSMQAVVAATIAGCGVANTFARLVDSDIAQGRLARLLPGSEYQHPGWFVYYSSRHHVPARLRIFIDYFRAANALKSPPDV